MSPSEEADSLIESWLEGSHTVCTTRSRQIWRSVIASFEFWNPAQSRAVVAQFMLRLMDQDPTSLHVFIEMLEEDL